MTTAKFLSEIAWRDLLREIQSGNVIPLIGPALITIDDSSGNPVSLYQLLAPNLAGELELENPSTYSKIESVARDFLIKGGDRRQLSIVLGYLIEQLKAPPPRTLLELASISDFDVFVSCTVDSFLVKALKTERKEFSPDSGVVRFHPSGGSHASDRALNLGRTDSGQDIPLSFRGALVYQIFGDFDARPDFAVSEEDYLEFLLGLMQNRDRLRNLFHLLENRTLLLLGSTSSNWILLLLLRIARGTRLSEDPHRVFIVGHQDLLQADAITVSSNARKAMRIVDGSPSAFVAELTRRWREIRGIANDIEFNYRRPAEELPVQMLTSTPETECSTEIRAPQLLFSLAGQPYNQEICRATPACFLFLIDQSASMEEPIAGTGPPKAEQVASAINYWINAMITKSTGDAGVKEWMEIAVVGYTTDDQGNPVIGTAFSRELAGMSEDGFVKVGQLQQNPLRVVQRNQLLVDPETSEILEIPVDVAEWIDPVAAKGTPMCYALYEAYGLLDRWILKGRHADCFPPIVIHFTDGETSDGGNPVDYAESIKSLATQHGNVLFFNCHISMQSADPIVFSGDVETLPDQFSKTLFHMSSVIPAPLLRHAKSEGFTLQPNARGFVFNADTVALLQFLDMGTRVSMHLH